jgi:hypothetical protein
MRFVTKRQVCIFTIGFYGISGNELPPPSVGGFSRAIVSHDESEADFRDRMQEAGMSIRNLLKALPVQPYSAAPTCGWSITKVGSMGDIIRQIKRETT